MRTKRYDLTTGWTLVATVVEHTVLQIFAEDYVNVQFAVLDEEPAPSCNDCIPLGPVRPLKLASGSVWARMKPGTGNDTGSVVVLAPANALAP